MRNLLAAAVLSISSLSAACSKAPASKSTADLSSAMSAIEMECINAARISSQADSYPTSKIAEAAERGLQPSPKEADLMAKNCLLMERAELANIIWNRVARRHPVISPQLQGVISIYFQVFRELKEAIDLKAYVSLERLQELTKKVDDAEANGIRLLNPKLLSNKP